MAATVNTPLSPAPRYPATQRPRFNTNPSLGGLLSPHIGSGKGKSSLQNNFQPSQETPSASNQTGLPSAVVPLTGDPTDRRPPPLPDRPAQPTSISNVQNENSAAIPMSVDMVPTPSPAISTNAMTGFPLPPFRESTKVPPSTGNQATSSSAGTSSSGHASTIDSTLSRIRPLPPRPGPPKPELVPEWEPDVKKHIPEEATLDSRIASYARLSEPPPKLRSQILARERGVATELKEYDRIESKGSAGERRGMLNSGLGTEAAAESVEREKLGMLRQPAVNGLVRIEKSSNQSSNKAGSRGDMSLRRRGKMRDQAIGMLSDLSGIAGEWVLDPSLPRLGSGLGIGGGGGGHDARPFLDSKGSATAYSPRTSLSASGSRNSLLPSTQGGHSLQSANSSSMMMVDDSNGSSIWKKRKRISQDVSRGKKSESFPAAVFETDKGNIDVRLAIVNEGARMQAVPRSGSTVMEHYMGSKATSGTAKTGLLNARSQDIHSRPADGSDLGADWEAGETCAKVEILTRKGNVRVELPEIQRGRQVALQITSRDGNIFLSLPENFVGPIQCSTAPNQSVLVLPSLKSRVETLYDDRGESLFYLGQRPNAKNGSSHPPILPPRRLSNRLRGLSSGHNTAFREASMHKPTVESPSAMEVDSPILLPNASRMTNSAAATLIPSLSTSPRSGMEAQVEENQESSVYVSSYTGSICIGLYGLEPKHVFKGASTLSGLMDGLGEAKKLLKDTIGISLQ